MGEGSSQQPKSLPQGDKAQEAVGETSLLPGDGMWATIHPRARVTQAASPIPSWQQSRGPAWRRGDAASPAFGHQLARNAQHPAAVWDAGR